MDIWFLGAIAGCFGRLSPSLGVLLSVCPSHSGTVSKRCKLKLQNFHRGLPQCLVFVTKFRAPGWGGFFWTKTSKRGTPLNVILPLLALLVWKRLQIGTHMLLIITSTGDKLFRFISNADLERPWTPKGFLVNFSQFLDAMHISTLICDDMAGDRPSQPAYEVFNSKRRF